MKAWLVRRLPTVAFGLLGLLVSVLPGDTAAGSTTCWHTHWKPASCDLAGDLREVGKTWVVRKFIIGESWGWWSYDQAKGQVVINDLESVLGGTQFFSTSEAGADLRIRHGNICAQGNPGCASYQWYYDSSRDGYYLSTWTSKLNTANFNFTVYSPNSWYHIASHETTHAHALDHVTQNCGAYPIANMETTWVDTDYNPPAVVGSCDSVYLTTSTWDRPKIQEFYRNYSTTPNGFYGAATNIMDMTWIDSSWAEKRYRVEIWRCVPDGQGGWDCNTNPGYFYHFANIADKEQTLYDSFTKPANWADAYYTVCIVTQNDTSADSTRLCDPYPIWLHD